VAINDDVLSDTLFLEAERHGIDTRPWTAGDKSAEEKTLLFNFFDDVPTTSITATAITNSSNSSMEAEDNFIGNSANSLSQNSINNISNNKKRKLDEDNEEGEGGGGGTTGTAGNRQERKLKRDVTAPSQLLPYVTSGEIARLAFLFCRVE